MPSQGHKGSAKSAARAIGALSRRQIGRHVRHVELGIVATVAPLTIDLVEAGLVLGEDILILGSAFRKYDRDFGVQAGDNVALVRQAAGDYYVLDVQTSNEVMKGIGTVAAAGTTKPLATFRTVALASGATLAANATVFQGGLLRLQMQNDGNLVLTHLPNSSVPYATGTSSAGSHLTMQANGDLIVFSSGNVSQFATGTGGNPGAFLIFGDNQIAVVSADGKTVLWTSNGSPPTVATLQAIAHWLEVYDSNGNSIGFSPVFASKT